MANWYVQESIYIYIHIYCVALKHWGLGQAQSPRQMKKEEAKGDKK